MNSNVLYSILGLFSILRKPRTKKKKSARKKLLRTKKAVILEEEKEESGYVIKSWINIFDRESKTPFQILCISKLKSVMDLILYYVK